MKAKRQLEEMKSVLREIDRMSKQPTSDRLSAYMGAAMKEVDMSRHMSYGQKTTLRKLIEDVYLETREDTIDTDAVIGRAPAGFFEILFT